MQRYFWKIDLDSRSHDSLEFRILLIPSTSFISTALVPIREMGMRGEMCPQEIPLEVRCI